MVLTQVIQVMVMSEVASETLRWDAFLTHGVPVVISDLPPGMKELMWSPISAARLPASARRCPVTFITIEQRIGRRQRLEPDDDLRDPRPR